ncbi:MAG TPA: hypothetical protein VEV63_13835 [Streptosporangiaceae bacterium]|nr:hypothetical protein [Streptosporangiaceae bacterium]
MADPLLLLYRADWTQWSLSAKVVRRSNRRLFPDLTARLAADMRRRPGGMAAFMWSALSASRQADGADEWSQTSERLLLAPGGRYRYEADLGQPAAERRHGRDDEDDEDEPRLVVSDGQSCWMIRQDEAEQSVADLSRPPFSDIVRPTWLMQQLQLSTTGMTETAGRAALQVRGTPRLPADRWGLFAAQLDHVDIAIDAELGLVLRWETAFDGRPLSSLAVTDLLIDPSAAADPASFRPDEGIDVNEDGIGPPESNLAWRGGGRESDIRIDKLRMTLNVARGAGYLAARRLARPEPASLDAAALREDEDAEMPAAAPPTPGPAPATPGSRRPVPDSVLHLIAHTGMAPLTLTAQVHHWLDGMLAARSVPWLAPGDMHERPGATGFLGAQEDSLFRLRDSHQTARLALAMPDRYRIDFEGEHRPRHPLTMACDGELLRKVYHNRVVSSPPLPMPTDFVRLVDPAWLLRDWPLSEAGEEIVNGRRAIRLIAERPPVRAARSSSLPDHTALIALAIDAELGIVLQQVSYLDGNPVNRYELRDVQPCESVDIAEFGRGVAPDLPEIHTSGAPIGDLDLPPSARAVGQATTELVNGARSAFGWLTNQARKAGGS